MIDFSLSLPASFSTIEASIIASSKVLSGFEGCFFSHSSSAYSIKES
jgi:hypothetical protein